MNKPAKPNLSGNRLYFFFVKNGHSNKIELLSEEEIQSRKEKAEAANLERDGEAHLDYEDEYWDADTVPLSTFMQLVSTLPEGVDWVLNANFSRHSESTMLGLSGTKVYTELEKEQLQEKYVADLIAYEKFKVEKKAAAEARNIASKKKKLEKLKKELGES